MLCNTTVDSRALLPLRDRGAVVASLNPMAGVPARFAVEGDRSAVIRAKRLARELRALPVEFRTSHMDLYAAGKTFATGIFLPLIAAAADCFSKSGAGTRNGIRISEALFHSSFARFPQRRQESLQRTLGARRPRGRGKGNPGVVPVQSPLARYYQQGAQFAQEVFSQRRAAFPAWDETRSGRLISPGPGVTQPAAKPPQALAHTPLFPPRDTQFFSH